MVFCVIPPSVAFSNEIADTWWGDETVVEEKVYTPCRDNFADKIHNRCKITAKAWTDENNVFLFSVIGTELLESSATEQQYAYFSTCLYRYRFRCRFQKQPFELEKTALCTNTKPDNAVWTTNGAEWNDEHGFRTTQGIVNVNADGSFEQRWEVPISDYLPSNDSCKWVCDYGYGLMNGECHELHSSIIGSYVHIEAGTFLMGSPVDEQCRYGSQEKLHEVTLTHDFKMQAHEVTRTQFLEKMHYISLERHFNDESLPVARVSWHEAAAYCNSLSRNGEKCYDCEGTGLNTDCRVNLSSFYECRGYRLPTEAEWEYAYRAGTNTMYYDARITSCEIGDNSVLKQMGWFYENSNMESHPVGMKTANSWGFYDLGGNVREWVQDYFLDDLEHYQTDPVISYTGVVRKVVRGGSYRSGARDLRGAHRYSSVDTVHSSEIGFRCVRSIN